RGVAQAPRLAEARAREAAAAATVTSRSTLAQPTLTTTAGYLRTNHVDEFGVPQANGSFKVLFPDIPDNYRVRAELGMPLFTGGRAGALMDVARGEQRAAGADRRVVEQ